MMIPQFNFIVLDVIVVAILVAILAAGIIKGTKHTLINIALLALSIGVGFISYTNFIKVPLVEILDKTIKIEEQISFDAEMKIGLSLMYMFIVSIALTLATYLLLRLIKLIIGAIIRKRAKSRGSKKSVVSRIFGGVLNLAVNGVLVIFALSMLNNPLVGLDKTIKDSYVTKYIADADNMFFDLIKKDGKEIETTIYAIAIKGDLLDDKITSESVKNFAAMVESLGSNTVTPEKFTLENAQEVVNNFYYLLTFEKQLLLDKDNKPLPGYEKFISISHDAVSRAISSISANYTGDMILNAQNTLTTHGYILELLGQEEADKFESIFVLN